MLKFIRNTGDYFSSNYFDEDFTSKVLSKTGYNAEDVKEFNKRITPLKEKFFRYKELYIEGRLRTKDKIFETHQFHTQLLMALGYDATNTQYGHLFHFTEEQVIPVRHILYRGDQPHLMVMEMQSLIKEDDNEPDGLFEQRYNVEDEEHANPAQKYHRLQWERVFTTPKEQTISPVIINKAVSQLFLLEPHQRPKYILLLAGNGLFLLEQEKWFRGSYLQFELEELFSEATANRNANYYALFYFLVGKETLAPDSNMVLLDQLDEDSHKSAYEVTKDLKEGIIHAVEELANEALEYLEKTLHEDVNESDDKFEQEIKDDCLRIIYRLLFIFYAESREDLDILPSNDATYNKGYSLEMLRDLEQVPLYSENSLNGFFFHESLSKLFYVLSSGYREKENGHNKSFKVRHIDSPIFDDRKLHHLHRVKFRNKVWQDIICRLSLSKQQRNKTRGRISYANLGINQLGSVYESLLAYRGFYAEQDYIEVHKKDKPEDGTYLVPRSRRDDFKEDEILKDNNHEDIILKKGKFVYRLSGRDRQKSASYYTPEVLTRCTVKYTLKPILEKLEKAEMKALELLDLKLLEPAMGAAAFHNEMINQLAEAYTSYRQKELRDSGKKEWKIEPDQYKEELQKVKAYIATHNVYGVDLNPTAIELGKLSLWLNVIHKDMETPFFSNRICVGNAVVGAWLKVYAEKDLIEEYEVTKSDKGKDKKTLVKKDWWEKAPKQLEFKPNSDFEKLKTNRKQNEVYHFLLPDKNMVSSAGIKILKDENQVFSRGVTTKKKEWTQPLSKTEFERVKAISNAIDELLAEYYRFQRNINLRTGSRQNIFGATKSNEQGVLQMQSYDEKEKLADQRNRHSAPYFKLKMVMDYWCSLWFWDVRQADQLPNRAQYWSDIANILQLDIDAILAKETEENTQTGLQGKLFYSGGKQLTLVEESENAPKVFIAAVVEYAERKDLFDENQRLKIVEELSKKYFFFHPQLEFLEVFWERGGFDLITGNPPWVGMEFNFSGVLSEVRPEVSIREYSDLEIQDLFNKELANQQFKTETISESILMDGLKVFMLNKALYPYVESRNNLYKNILFNSISMLNNLGVCGLIHPEKLFYEAMSLSTRQYIYYKLKSYFQFQNENKLFSEVGNAQTFSINIYTNNSDEVNITAIFSLFHPSTIESSFAHNGLGFEHGMKYKNNEGQYKWNDKPHKNRIIKFNESVLQKLGEIFQEESDWRKVKPANLFSQSIYEIIKNFENHPKLLPAEYSFSVGYNEALAPREGLIVRNTAYPNLSESNFCISGPHFYVSNPFYQTPKEICDSHRAYEIIYPSYIESDFLPRTNYKVLELGLAEKYQNWIKAWKLVFPKMQNNPGERTLQCSIFPPGTSHIDSVVSLIFKDQIKGLLFCGMTSSIVYDFYIKLIGKKNFREDVISMLPFVHFQNNSYIVCRVLLLNCLNQYFSDLWNENYSSEFLKDEWSKKDSRLTEFNTLSADWDKQTPLRNWFERRQALVELDVLVAISIGLSVEQLCLIYSIQFPVLQQNEDDTWYDIKGEIVYTCSKGLTGVGVDTNVWNKIKDLKSGEVYNHTIEKSESYKGKTLAYSAPFEKCDRIEDYKMAWKHFENKFKEN